MPKFTVEFTDKAIKNLIESGMMIKKPDGIYLFTTMDPKNAADELIYVRMRPVEESPPIRSVYKVDWTEYERGFGQRDCGPSHYLTLEDAEKAVQNYNDSLPSREELGGVPECYIMPGTPYLAEVDENIYQNLIINSI